MTERRWPRRLVHRYGHRAVFLWLFAVIYLSTSVTLLLMPHVVMRDLFHTYPPESVRAVIWASGAIVALFTARGWGGGYQWLGFWALGFAPAQRLVSYAFAVAINAYHLSPMAFTRLSAMLIYVLWLTVLWLISTWQDEVDVDQLANKILAPSDPVTP